MPRRKRIVLAGVAHHVTQRGNNRQSIFIKDEDFRNYCYWVNEYAREYHVDVLAYCLMNNHVHFIVVPQDGEGMARLFRSAHMRYSQYFNYDRQMNGHVWQSRFFSSPLDDAHLLCAMRYVEQNPVKAGMVQRAWDYEYSSAKWHVGEKSHRYIFVKESILVDTRRWKKHLEEGDLSMDEIIEANTQKGLALANKRIVEDWEQKLGVQLHAKQVGRPKKLK